MAIFCILGLVTEKKLWPMIAASLAPTGALMAFLSSLDGGISLGSSNLGAYWVWDARLTSALILFFFLPWLLGASVERHPGLEKGG